MNHDYTFQFNMKDFHGGHITWQYQRIFDFLLSFISVSCGYQLTVTDEKIYKTRSYTIASVKLRRQQIIGRIQLDQGSAIL